MLDMRKMQIKNVSSLEKIFPEMECRVSTCNRGSILKRCGVLKNINVKEECFICGINEVMT